MENKSDTNKVRTDNMGRVIFLSTIAAIGGFLFGFDSGVINGTVGALQEAFNSDAVGTGFNVASMLLGCALGAFFGGNLADKFGRKPILLITAVAFIISAYGSGAAGSSLIFVMARILGGFAVGAASVLVPAYISEIAPPKVRGALTTLMQLMIVIGLFIAFISNYNIAGSAGGATEPFWGGFDAWQWMFWVEMIPAGFFFLGLLFIPESPRYLVAAGKLEKAKAVLNSLSYEDTANEKIKDIQSTLEKNRKPKLSDIISKHTGKIQPIIWVGLGLTTLQQFTGINVVFYYGATLWQAAGFTEENALLQNVISGSVNVLFTFVAIALVDKVGRKPLLMIGALGQAVMLGILALIFGTAAVADGGSLQLEGNMGLYALLSANGYIAFFAFTWGPIMWVMLGEMFPNQFRGAALAVCGLIHWLSNFTITMTFPVLLASIGLGLSYGIYAGFGVIAFFFVKRFIVETKGRTLEDMSRDIQN
ncbi:sugar porter family MFS transporter [Rhodohalobacter sp.]|uniref:sugar porter family MFS transporter n=1 Tax=Rhodohalobacter sp. TaxID=1974210 RepID=UPI002ACD9125|nr:sugar porter family MFS transporter [Rhodohalobacter sp.]MDZ7757968.1 sugar porter family MFS transporter [Rhodohalobacter sp.]